MFLELIKLGEWTADEYEARAVLLEGAGEGATGRLPFIAEGFRQKARKLRSEIASLVELSGADRADGRSARSGAAS